MESEPDSLIDRAEVADTVTRLFINTDERNWEGVADCFATVGGQALQGEP